MARNASARAATTALDITHGALRRSHASMTWLSQKSCFDDVALPPNPFRPEFDRDPPTTPPTRPEGSRLLKNAGERPISVARGQVRHLTLESLGAQRGRRVHGVALAAPARRRVVRGARAGAIIAATAHDVSIASCGRVERVRFACARRGRSIHPISPPAQTRRRG